MINLLQNQQLHGDPSDSEATHKNMYKIDQY